VNSDEFFARLRDPLCAALPALVAHERTWSYATLDENVSRFADQLRAADITVLASHLDNGADWILSDLACLRAGIVHVPLPLFFTSEQVRGILAATGAGAMMASAATAATWEAIGFRYRDTLSPQTFLYTRYAQRQPLPAGTAKITFTSGSTGAPKGVCLDAKAMLATASDVCAATQALGITRHVNALPLAVLLENIAGVYAALIARATNIAPSLMNVGLRGSSAFDPVTLASAIEHYQAQSLILLPQMLRAYVAYLHATKQRAPATLKFVAVGGAPAGAKLLHDARALGIPAYEGYGLSEGASVQTLNLPGADRPGSVGRVLPHARLRVAADGELEIAGKLFLGYLGASHPQAHWLPTGDLGRIDEEGYVHLSGRKKNVLITGFGRNISPEWIETELRSEALIAQAVVLGDGEPALGAVLWLTQNADDDAIQHAIAHVNERLPDYARIGPWLRANAEFSAASGLATANGRPQRDAIAAKHPELFTLSTRLSTQAKPLESTLNSSTEDHP
jgi:long-subunit acyl-CoA synthetase (AMP-forming)